MKDGRGEGEERIGFKGVMGTLKSIIESIEGDFSETLG